MPANNNVKRKTNGKTVGGKSKNKGGKKSGAKQVRSPKSSTGKTSTTIAGAIHRAKELAAAEGMRGVDPRMSGLSPDNALGKIAMTQLDHSVDVTAVMSVESIAALSLGPVLEAIRRGWLATKSLTTGLAGPTIAYNAWVFLTQSFLNVTQGVYPTLQSAPEWYWQICDALRPKVVPFKTADVAYRTVLTQGDVTYVPASVWNYGSTPSAIVFGEPDTNNLVNGLPTLVPSVYSASAAIDSVQALFDFFPDSLMNKRSSGSTVPYLVKDPSAFASVFPELGFANGNSGGLATSISSEVYIPSPILCKFGVYDDLRGYTELRKGAGSATYVIPRVMEFTDMKQFHNKCSPVFKYYNFDRYFEILSLALAKGMELANSATVGTLPTICPLTSQQVQILLRQAILPLFSNHMAQELSTLDGVVLTPFCTAVNGYASAGSDMLLPSFLTEAIRTVYRKTTQLSEEYPNYQLDVVPILARSPDILQLGNYTWNAGSYVYAEADPQAPEVPIDLIDMSAVLPAVGKVYTLPCCSVNYELLQDWNQFMLKMSPVMAGVSAIGTEHGITCLSSLYFSDFVCPVSVGDPGPVPMPTQGKSGQVPTTTAVPTPQPGRKNSVKGKKEYGMPRIKRVGVSIGPSLGSTQYGARAMICTSTSIAENGPEWKYQRLIPHAYWEANSVGGDFFISRRQVFQQEGFKVSHTTQDINILGGSDAADTSQTVYNMDLAAASLCVRGQLASESEVERDIRIMAEKGRGGFLANIAGILGEDVLGIKGAKEFTSRVGALTGL